MKTATPGMIAKGMKFVNEFLDCHDFDTASLVQIRVKGGYLILKDRGGDRRLVPMDEHIAFIQEHQKRPFSKIVTIEQRTTVTVCEKKISMQHRIVFP